MVVALVQARLLTGAVVGQGPPAAALWQRLRRAFPWTVAAVLRERGVAWIGRAPSVARARQAMERVWAPLRRRLGWPPLELDVREVAPHKVGAVAHRVLGDTEGVAPGWSTARDLLGGIVDPWVTPTAVRQLTWGRSGPWIPISLPAHVERTGWLDPVRAALRAPWLHATAPTVSGLMRGVRARVHGEGDASVPSAWVDAALRCALDPRLRGFPQPSAPPGVDPWPHALRPWRSRPARGLR